MGLDIYNMKIIKKEDLPPEIKDGIDHEELMNIVYKNDNFDGLNYLSEFEAEYPNEKRLFEKFKEDKVLVKNVTLFDFEKSFKCAGLNIDDYSWYSMEFEDNPEDEDNPFTIVKFYEKNKEDPESNIISFSEKDNSLKIKKMDINYLIIWKDEDGFYQRKGMKQEFYDKYTNCWYMVNENDAREEDPLIYLFKEDKDLLKDIKKYAEENTNILNYEIKDDNEVLVFSY